MSTGSSQPFEELWWEAMDDTSRAPSSEGRDGDSGSDNGGVATGPTPGSNTAHTLFRQYLKREEQRMAGNFAKLAQLRRTGPPSPRHPNSDVDYNPYEWYSDILDTAEACGLVSSSRSSTVDSLTGNPSNRSVSSTAYRSRLRNEHREYARLERRGADGTTSDLSSVVDDTHSGASRQRTTSKPATTVSRLVEERLQPRQTLDVLHPLAEPAPVTVTRPRDGVFSLVAVASLPSPRTDSIDDAAVEPDEYSDELCDPTHTCTDDDTEAMETKEEVESPSSSPSTRRPQAQAFVVSLPHAGDDEPRHDLYRHYSRRRREEASMHPVFPVYHCQQQAHQQYTAQQNGEMSAYHWSTSTVVSAGLPPGKAGWQQGSTLFPATFSTTTERSALCFTPPSPGVSTAASTLDASFDSSSPPTLPPQFATPPPALHYDQSTEKTSHKEEAVSEQDTTKFSSSIISLDVMGRSGSSTDRGSAKHEYQHTLAKRFRTELCRNFTAKGRCPYDARCMYAHGELQLRTLELNLRDGITSEEAIREFKTKSMPARKWRPRELQRKPPAKGGSRASFHSLRKETETEAKLDVVPYTANKSMRVPTVTVDPVRQTPGDQQRHNEERTEQAPSVVAHGNINSNSSSGGSFCHNPYGWEAVERTTPPTGTLFSATKVGTVV